MASQRTDSLQCRKRYDAASPEILTVTTDKLKVWLEECQSNFLKQKYMFYNPIQNFVAVLGIFISLVTTLMVTTFDTELWKAIYIVTSVVIFILLIYLGYCCINACKNRNPEKISDCIMRKMNDDSIVYVGEDAP